MSTICCCVIFLCCSSAKVCCSILNCSAWICSLVIPLAETNESISDFLPAAKTSPDLRAAASAAVERISLAICAAAEISPCERASAREILLLSCVAIS